MRINEQTKLENRARILEKSAEIFLAKGYENCTTRDIATSAGLAAGTLFNYFPSKETLAMTMVAEALGQGAEDYKQRITGNEGLAEELFLFISSGLRRLRPMRPFIGPVLERSLSPFPRKNICPEGEAARLEHLGIVQEIIGRHGFSEAPDFVSITIYWSLYLGILAFWASDDSRNQESTKALIDYSISMYVQIITGTGSDQGADHAE